MNTAEFSLSHLSFAKLTMCLSGNTCTFFFLGFPLFFLIYFIDYAVPFSQFFPLCLRPPGTPIPSNTPPLSSCPWVMHISSLASPFPILFLTSTCLFCTYKFILLSPWIFPPISPSLLITLQRNSIFMILFLFCLFA